MQRAGDDKSTAYTFDARGRLLHNGEPVPRGHRMPRSEPPTNPDGTKATREDTEEFAQSLVGLTVADAEAQGLTVPHIELQLSTTEVFTADWKPFRVLAIVKDGRVDSVIAG